jgi:hypothetical protein
MHTLSNPGGMVVAEVHSYSMLTLSTADPLTRTVDVVVAAENAAAVIGSVNFEMPMELQKVIDASNVGESFIPRGVKRENRV